MGKVARFPLWNDFASVGNSDPNFDQDKNVEGDLTMRTRAAVALEAGKPLEIMEVNLDAPREGEVLVEIKATRPVSHRRVHPLGR